MTSVPSPETSDPRDDASTPEVDPATTDTAADTTDAEATTPSSSDAVDESTDAATPADGSADVAESAGATDAAVNSDDEAQPATGEDAGEPAAESTPDAASAESEAPETPAAPQPAARPVPGARIPGPPPGATASKTVTEPWGRVDDEGTVSVREADGWRIVGQYPDGTPAEALAYFQRKFADLAGEVTLLETRHRRGGATASDLRSTAKTLRTKLDGAAAVGDLAALIGRVDALTAELAEASETEAVANKQASEEAVRERTAIVEEAEALAARDPQTVQWKQMTADMAALFDRWQAHQQNGPRLSKSTAQQLWRRFRDARATVDRHRREFFSSLDETHKAAREAKTRLVERAEALAPRGEDGIGAYRDLLDAWKASGRAGRKVDDALWARFKAAGDALYGARIERESADAEASKEKIEQKRVLLEQAAPIVDEKNLATARQKLTAIQRQWDEIGRIFPRDKERALDDELRKIEQSVRTREDADWKRNDPEQKARANDMTRQLTDAIDKLEAELADAEARGDKRAAAQASEALEARRTWLRALGG
ncbi:protein of unknown function [Microbacterium sp. ru370.1]|uniref:DUF349 domain-containing protein n=1 Tax=unclassified Microbacterium TaxID=2609290 RepID=UPI0008866D33|nr:MULTISPECIES: DUF349 domain-containing protein [unclassified Microbacterium]SDO75408.1 protein of unknown function [Microbacterium sp. ru370.1]SIT88322.1 protein of unknown function [Microbacterium sp. RU1D]